MPDVWATVADLDPAVQDRLVGVLESRGADAQQQAMRRAFLGAVVFGGDARMLEAGCGTGALTRMLARWPGIAAMTGADVAGALGGVPRAVPGRSPRRIRRRLLDDQRRGRRRRSAAGLRRRHDGRVGQRPLAGTAAPAFVRGAGFEITAFSSHGFAETADAGYMLTVVDRGADILHGDGRIGEELRDALKVVARRRLAAGRFFGHVAYTSCQATKPAAQAG